MTTEQLLHHFAEIVLVKCRGCDGRGTYDDWCTRATSTGSTPLSVSSGTTCHKHTCKMCGGLGQTSVWVAKRNAGSVAA
jgi:hypothetical protein